MDRMDDGRNGRFTEWTIGRMDVGRNDGKPNDNMPNGK